MFLKRFVQPTLFVALFCFTALLSAEELGYETLTPPQPTQNKDKIEVIEFFWYGCPHCYHLENGYRQMVKNQTCEC